MPNLLGFTLCQLQAVEAQLACHRAEEPGSPSLHLPSLQGDEMELVWLEQTPWLGLNNTVMCIEISPLSVSYSLSH